MPMETDKPANRTAPNGAAPECESLSFTEFLLHRCNCGEQATKGERTRDRIVAAAARLLCSGGYHQLRIADIAREAEVASGSIYQYFENKTEITIVVLREFLDRIEQLLLGKPLSGDYAADIRETNLRYVRLFMENAGLMRCLRLLGEEIPEVGEMTAKTYAEWRRRLARNLVRWSGATPAEEKRVAMTAHALFVMGTEFLYDRFVRREPTLVGMADSPEEIADFLSDFWRRTAEGGRLS